jgi:hypothetical protein
MHPAKRSDSPLLYFVQRIPPMFGKNVAPDHGWGTASGRSGWTPELIRGLFLEIAVATRLVLD